MREHNLQPDPPAARGATAALVLLLAINLLNYVDRWVLAAVEPDIRRSLLLDAAEKGTGSESARCLSPFPGSVDEPNPVGWGAAPATPAAVASNDGEKLGLRQPTTCSGRGRRVEDPSADVEDRTPRLRLHGLLHAHGAGLRTLGRRVSRWVLAGVGVGLWSLASGASGLAAGFTMLLLTRCFVGVGEGAYGPVAPAILSDLYPAAKRGRVLAWFYVAMPIGTALGYALGGQIARINPAAESWRWAFFVVVVPGLLLALWSVLMREPRATMSPTPLAEEPIKSPLPLGEERTMSPLPLGEGSGVRACTDHPADASPHPNPLPKGEGTNESNPSRRLCFSITPPRGTSPVMLKHNLPVTLKHNLRPLFRTPSYVLNTAGMTAMTFALGAFGFWMPGYLKDNDIAAPGGIEVRTFFGAVLALAGLLATPTGGMIADALRRRIAGSYFLVAGVGLCLSVPCAWAFLVVPFPAAWGFVFLAVFFLFLGMGPSNAIIANVTAPSMRAAGFAINIFVIHVAGRRDLALRRGLRRRPLRRTPRARLPAGVGLHGPGRRALALRGPPPGTRHRGC